MQTLTYNDESKEILLSALECYYECLRNHFKDTQNSKEIESIKFESTEVVNFMLQLNPEAPYNEL